MGRGTIQPTNPAILGGAIASKFCPETKLIIIIIVLQVKHEIESQTKNQKQNEIDR